MRATSDRPDPVSRVLESGPFDLVSWDFDGVIADSEPWQRESYIRMLEQRGISVAPDFFARLIGKNEGQIWELIKSDHPVAGDVEELRAERTELFLALVAEPLKPSWVAATFVPRFHALGVRQVVVSSGNESVLRQLLAAWGLGDYFTSIRGWSGSASTPKRDVLHEEIRSATRCAVFEDDRGYLQLARELGAFTVGVRHSMNALEDRDADVVVDLRAPGVVPVAASAREELES